MFKRYSHDIVIAVEAILANKVRSLLTALGIIFGVAAVISMLAIGSGAQQEILEQIKQVGVNNIIIKPVSRSSSNSTNSDEQVTEEKKGYSPGLTTDDVEAIRAVLPSIEKASSVVSLSLKASQKGLVMPVKLEGVNASYFDLFNIMVAKGSTFGGRQELNAAPVCLIGDNIRATFFNDENPVGQMIKCGNNWLRVIGVLEKRDFTTSASDEMGISSSDNKIFVPVNTMLIRYQDKNKLDFNVMTQVMRSGSYGGGSQASNTVNQLDKIVIQVKHTEQLGASAELIRRMLLRRHNYQLDFEVTVPELLLKQQQQTNRIFNIVLGAIAGISLIVGGIGIMNIMLASVLERIREIGTRQAIGATRKDIVVQFLSESVLISFVGGLIGIVLGLLLARLITAFADIKTIITPFSVLIAFGVSATVGIVFGLVPAKRASEQDPVESLRY